MKNNENWEKEYAEVQVDEKTAEEVVTEDTDEVVSDETVDADYNDDECVQDCETCAEGRLRRRERIAIIIIVFILSLLMVWLITWLTNMFRGAEDARKENGSEISPTDTVSIEDPRDENPDLSFDVENGGTQWTVPTQPATVPGTTVNNGKTTGSQGNSTTPPANSTIGKGNNTQTPATNNDNNDKGVSQPAGNSADQNKPIQSDDGNSGNNGDQNKDAGNAASDYTGDTKIRISTVNDDTGVVTLTIDGSSIAVPLQTTYFNGRVTKSGVAQGKLFGYNAGVTVMFFYPQTEGFHTTEVNAFMSRTSDALTVLVDINGDGSKLLIKVNGMKSLF